MKKRVHGLEMEMTPVNVYDRKIELQTTTAIVQMQKFLNFLREIEQCDGDFFRVILSNEGQIYVDNDHMEICTPECTSIRDLVLHSRISREIVAVNLKLFRKRKEEDSELQIFSFTTDAHAKTTCGCHENYQLVFNLNNRDYVAKKILPPFLVARKLLEGSGFLGCNFSEREIFFRISQRLGFIKKIMDAATVSDRPMICSRDESLQFPTDDVFRSSSSPDQKYERRQILIGEHNQSPFCDFVKFASVSLLWEMMEEGYFSSRESLYFKELNSSCLPIFMATANSDLRCQKTYELQDGRFIRLCEVLEIYANWMLDYLENRYDGEKDYLYIEKTEVAKKIIYAADCFRREDIFALDRDIDWIIKLRWMQDYIKEIADIEIGDDEIDAWENLSLTLKSRWRHNNPTGDLDFNNFIEKILWRNIYWHLLGPGKNFYQIWEDCGLVNPLVIDGQAIDLKEEIALNIDKAPMNPPNRSYARWQCQEFMRKLGLKEFLCTEWAKCKIIGFSAAEEHKLIRILGQDDERVEFPWNLMLRLEENPTDYNAAAVEEFIEKVKRTLPIVKLKDKKVEKEP